MAGPDSFGLQIQVKHILASLPCMCGDIACPTCWNQDPQWGRVVCLALQTRCCFPHFKGERKTKTDNQAETGRHGHIHSHGGQPEWGRSEPSGHPLNWTQTLHSWNSEPGEKDRETKKEGKLKRESCRECLKKTPTPGRHRQKGQGENCLVWSERHKEPKRDRPLS